MRLRRKIFIALGATAGLAVLIPWLCHEKLRAANEAYIAQLAAQGEPMTLDEVRPPPVPASENSADAFVRAAALLETDTSLLQTNGVSAMLPVAPGQAVANSQQNQAVGYECTNSWKEVSQALAQNKTILDLLQQITAHPAIDLHINYDRLADGSMLFTNLHLPGWRKAEAYLTAAVISSLHEGKVPAAVRYERASVALIIATQNERLAICELLRIAMLYDAQKSCWELLQSPDLTDDELARLQHDWEQLRFIQSGLAALTMERAAGEITLARYRQSASGFLPLQELEEKAREKIGFPHESASLLARTGTGAKIFAWRFWWSYPDELRSLKGYQVLLGSYRLIATNGCFKAAITNQEAALDCLQIPRSEGPWAVMFGSDDKFHSMMSESVRVLSDATDKVMVAEAGKRMTCTAIALQRFKRAYGHYPNHLGELIPEFLTGLPLDPVDGQPLRYRRNADKTFLLYSIGENGVDDGGNPATADPANAKTFYWLSSQALDWVWPQATTADNVQFIYMPPSTAK